MNWSRDGDKHDRNAVIGAASILVGCIAAQHIFTGVLVSTTVVVWGLWFSPDLDLSESGRSKGGACKAWHRWKRLGLGWFWKPYGMRFKHRSKGSHSLLPGTLIRIAYVAFIPVLLTVLFHFQLISLPDFIWEYLPKLPVIVFTKHFYEWVGKSLLAGCLLADGIHLWTDKILLKRLVVLP